MRLWHPSILQELPSCTLSTLHMSLCRVRQKPWGRPTPRTWYYNLSWECLCWYHSQVIHEMNQRTWHSDQRWLDYSYRGQSEPAEGEWDMAANRSWTGSTPRRSLPRGRYSEGGPRLL